MALPASRHGKSWLSNPTPTPPRSAVPGPPRTMPALPRNIPKSSQINLYREKTYIIKYIYIYPYSLQKPLFWGCQKKCFFQNNPCFFSKVFGYGKLWVNDGKLRINYGQITCRSLEIDVFLKIPVLFLKYLKKTGFSISTSKSRLRLPYGYLIWASHRVPHTIHWLISKSFIPIKMAIAGIPHFQTHPNVSNIKYHDYPLVKSLLLMVKPS